MADMNEKKDMIKSLFTGGKIKSVKFKELAGFLGVPKDERGELNKILDELINENVIELDSGKRYRLCKSRTVTGIYKPNSRGFAFVVNEEENIDVFIGRDKGHGAIYGDEVRVKLLTDYSDIEGNNKRLEGEVTGIISHSLEYIVGMLSIKKNTCFLIPDNSLIDFDVYIPMEKVGNLVSGTKVVVKLVDYGSKDKNPVGEIVEVIGHINEPGVDVLSVIKSFEIPYEFSEENLNYVAANIKPSVSSEDYIGRKDYKNLLTVTIDGEDAKDLDDAITISKNDDNYLLGVHIADVSNYVTEGNPIDRDALIRGTSVYTADRVVPMIPRELSNGICSLNEGVDRLALSCMMVIDKSGKIISHSIEETIINVDRRMSYTETYAIIESIRDNKALDFDLDNKYIEMVDLMYELSSILRRVRYDRGAIDFETVESKISLDDAGKVIEIKPYERNDAHKIIEDFMLAANETIAEEFFWLELPFVYRVHEEPDKEKLEELNEVLKGFSLSIHAQNDIHVKEYQKLLEKIKGKDFEAVVNRLVLRSMKQAKYSVNPIGHFGLAARYYCHFTSPIRRYPDLQIHRIIKEYLHGELNGKRISHYNEILPSVAASTSKCERRAEECERDTLKMKKAEYMQRFIGHSFSGYVSGITNWGIYVELPNTVEGLVRFSDITDDYYTVDKTGTSCISERTKRTIRIGDKVDVTVASCSKQLKTVDFIFDNEKK